MSPEEALDLYKNKYRQQRKLIQIAPVHVEDNPKVFLVGLCDDGTLWWGYQPSDETLLRWVQLPTPSPVDEKATA